MSNKNYEKILSDISETYKLLYLKKDIFDKKLFKNNVDKVDDMIKYFLSEHSEKSKTKRKTSKEKVSPVSMLSTKEDAHKYYYENLIYDRSDSTIENSVVKKHSSNDLKRLYFLILGDEIKATKIVILQKLQLYFDSIERSKKI